MNCADFVEAGWLVWVFSAALAATVPLHVADLITSWAPGPEVTDVNDVFDSWLHADDEHVRDLAALLAWRQSLTAFADVEKMYPPEKQHLGYQTLMTIAGNNFTTSDRAMDLCKQYAASEDGGYVTLGGGLLRDGGSYFVHPDGALITTHVWFVNEALGGPALVMPRFDPGTLFYLQRYALELLMTYTKSYREVPRMFPRS